MDGQDAAQGSGIDGMRILITGITGFAGRHLARALLAGTNATLFGLSRQRGWSEADDDLHTRVRLFRLDLSDSEETAAVLQEARPEQIYHLAGYADAGRSFREPEAAWTGNLSATRCLYEAILRWGGQPRVLYVSSGAVYGEPEEPGQSLHEHAVLRPNSPYAASKAAADLASYQYFRAHGLPIIRARPFNHIGPGQPPQYAIANFARQLAAIERGEAPPVLRTGNLWVERDLTDVRDVVRAYIQLMARGTPGMAYNIASGRTQTLQIVLDRLIGMTRARVTIETAPELVRAIETPCIRVDITRLRQTTGWTPAYDLDQTLLDTLNYWRNRAAEGNAA